MFNMESQREDFERVLAYLLVIRGHIEKESFLIAKMIVVFHLTIDSKLLVIPRIRNSFHFLCFSQRLKPVKKFIFSPLSPQKV